MEILSHLTPIETPVGLMLFVAGLVSGIVLSRIFSLRHR